VGDVLDEIFEMSLRNAVVRGTVTSILDVIFSRDILIAVFSIDCPSPLSYICSRSIGWL